MVHKLNLKRIVFYLLILICLQSGISAKDYAFENIEWIYTYAEKYYFNNGEYIKETIDQNENFFLEKGKYKIYEEDGYIKENIVFSKERVEDIYIFNDNDRHLIIYNKTKKKQIECTNSKYNVDEAWIWPINECTATSFLTEKLLGKEVSYIPKNLELNDLTKNWVEGVEGQGIGEKLYFSNYEIDRCKVLYIVNGFFEPNKPYLFYKNGRAKRIILRCFIKDKFVNEEEFILSDNGYLQRLELDRAYDSYEMEIVDVYPGAVYSDTAISGIFFDGLSISY